MKLECPGCGEPSEDGGLCRGERSCTFGLERDLGDVPALVWAGAVGYSGQARIERPPAGTPPADPDRLRPLTAKVQSLPWDEGASRALRELRTVLVGWVRVVVEERRIAERRVVGPMCVLCVHESCRAVRFGGWPADRLDAMARWLLGHVGWLRQHPDAAELLDDISAAVKRLQRAMDRAPELVYAGPCTAQVPVEVDGTVTVRECGHDLYAAPSAAAVTCMACRAEYDVESRRDWLQKAAEDVLDTATAISRALTGLGSPVTPDRIRQWVARGRLLPRGSVQRGERVDPTYRVGDVQELLIADAQATERKARRHGEGARSA